MIPFIKLTPQQAAAILAGDSSGYQYLNLENLTPELREWIRANQKTKGFISGPGYSVGRSSGKEINDG